MQAAATMSYQTPSNAYSEMSAPSQPPPTHPAVVGYLFWILGFTGAHRFYFGKPLTGMLWFFTGGLFLIGWIVDLFFIPSMAERSESSFSSRQD